MQKFDYRYPRFAVDLPARLMTQDSTRIGRCVDIGKEGLKLELDQSLRARRLRHSLPFLSGTNL